MEFLTNLSPMQWVGIAVAALLILPGSVWPMVKGVIGGIKLPNVKPSKPEQPQEGDDLTILVGMWEDLADACQDAELDEAYEKLYDIFPYLIQVRDQVKGS